MSKARTMPVVLRIDGYIFFFYSNEGDPREPIHVHVRRSGSEAKIWLEPTIGVAESKGFNSREQSAILRNVIIHRILIEKAWRDYFGN
ncbi:DUF4160 domain-containing protein [Ciceribacter selenitireducens]